MSKSRHQAALDFMIATVSKVLKFDRNDRATIGYDEIFRCCWL